MMDSRAEFERATRALATWTPNQAFDRTANGSYEVREIRDMWRGWNARTASLLAMLDSEETVELVAASIFDSMHEENYANEREGILKHMQRDAAKAALQATKEKVGQS